MGNAQCRLQTTSIESDTKVEWIDEGSSLLFVEKLTWFTSKRAPSEEGTLETIGFGMASRVHGRPKGAVTAVKITEYRVCAVHTEYIQYL